MFSSKLISINGSHDCSCVFVDKQDKIRIFEYERFVDVRYAMFSQKFDGHPLAASENAQKNFELRKEFLEYVKTQLKEMPEVILCEKEVDIKDFDLFLSVFPNSKVKQLDRHHSLHASCGYYQSPFNNALVFTIDGGGCEDGSLEYTKVYHASGSEINLISKINVNFGGAYTNIAIPIKEIIPGKDSVEPHIPSIVYAGKVMGLCAYGKVIPEWLDAMRNFYYNINLNTLSSSIGVNLSPNSLSGEVAYNLAATSQYVFDEMLFDLVVSYFEKYKTNIVISGGCGLNVLFNQKIKKYINSLGFDVYVPANPNDCGLSLGQYLIDQKCHVDPVVYAGFDILDKEDIGIYLKDDSYDKENLSVERIVDLIESGKIGGIIQGYSEVGPRALGNRSIICDPSIADMKDIINSKVKFREWFRPFAPVCREEDMNFYFDDAFPSEYMSYAPSVKKEYQDVLPSITHVDGTARLQTVRKDQHKLFYDILSCMKNRNKIPVILNTSFNIKGKPILTRIKDAFHVLNTTELDFLVVENFLFCKKKNQ
jgi:carbamoyltransferase